LLLVGSILAFSVFIAMMANKIGVPSLVAFLALGMFIGTDMVGDVAFYDVHLAQTVGIIALTLILFEGGLSTSWRRLRQVAIPATLLSTLGVIITAGLSAVFIKMLFDLSWLESLLFGAVISSTDAAAVFSSLRFTKIKVKLARTLEAETGINDPMAIALVIGLIAWIENPGYSISSFLWLISEQMGWGLVIGAGLGLLSIKIFSKLPGSIGSFAPVASLAACALTYGITTSIGGSGFLAVYLVGLAIGSTPSRYRQQLVAFHEGIAFLAQVVLFIVLGILIAPDELKSVAIPGLIIAVLLILVIRPVASFTSLAFSKFSARERLFLGLAGLRGAVPIVLGTFVLSSEAIDSRFTIFNAVFFIVLASAIMQGVSLDKLAKILKLEEPGLLDEKHPQKKITKNKMYEFLVESNHSINGAMVKDAALPKSAILASIRRDGRKQSAKNNTVIKNGDILFVIASEDLVEEVYDVFARWRRRI
jgi:potassium/hydrogen antiporter